MVQTSNLLFPGPGKSKMVQTSNCKMVQTSNLLFPGPGKSKRVQTSNLLFPMVQTSNLLFPGPGKSKMYRTSNLESNLPHRFPIAFASLETNNQRRGGSSPQPSAYEPGALSIRPQLAGKMFQAHERGNWMSRLLTQFAFPGSSFQFAFSRAGKKQNGPNFQFAFSPQKAQASNKKVQTSNLLFPGPGKSKGRRLPICFFPGNGSDI